VAGRPADIFIGQAGQQGQQDDAAHQPPQDRKRAKRREKQDRDQHQRQQECRPAAGMFQRKRRHVFRGERHVGLEGVDRLMFCAVIGEDALDVGDQADQPDVGHQDGQPHQPFDQVAPPGAQPQVTLGELPNGRRSQEEQAHAKTQRQQQGKEQCRPFDFLVFARLDVCGDGQSPDAQSQGVPQHHQATQEGDPGQPAGIDAAQGCLVDDNFILRVTHGDGVILPAAHHHALDDGLAAVSGKSYFTHLLNCSSPYSKFAV